MARQFPARMFTEGDISGPDLGDPGYTSMNGIICYNKTLLGQLGFDAFRDDG